MLEWKLGWFPGFLWPFVADCCYRRHWNL